jgi:hypothetical protein
MKPIHTKLPNIFNRNDRWIYKETQKQNNKHSSLKIKKNKLYKLSSHQPLE